MTDFSSIRLRAAGMLAGLSLLLSGCFLQPGSFTSQLTLLDNNEFTFTYEGEVYFIGLARLIEEQERSSQPTFSAYCYGPEPGATESTAEDAAEKAAETADEAANAAPEPVRESGVAQERITTVAIPADESVGSRECTTEEEAEQLAEWEERQVERRARDREQMERFSQLLGGIDPSDPNAEKELATLLERQRGFDKVVAKGDGLFDVSYSISGTLNHDFRFPMMEGFASANSFVEMFVRDGNIVRINAPGFSAPSQGNPMLAYLAAAPGFTGSRNDDLVWENPKVDGTFTIITDGDIRANNTDEGPITEGDRQKLTWQINSRTAAWPTALIAMPE